MTMWLLIAATLAGAAHATDLNPYSQPKSPFESHLRDAQFGKPGADFALIAWMRTHPEIPSSDRLLGFKQICGDFSLFTWNKAAQSACTEEAKLQKSIGSADEGAKDAAMADAFADAPPIRTIGAARVPLVWNAFGSQSTTISVNGVAVPWLIDTGAQISVVTRSLAQKIGVKNIADDLRVGTSTSDVVGQVGIIDTLNIGDAAVENVPVLVLPDEQLKVGGNQIQAILGIQVFAAFGRMAWMERGRMLALGEAAPRAHPNAPHIYWDEEGLGVPVGTWRGVKGAFLDTGANVTDWRLAGLPLIDSQLLAAAKQRTMHVGGAGGIVEVKQRELSGLNFRLGSIPILLRDVSISDDGKASAAKVGMDAVSQLDTLIVDFEQMRIDGRLKTTPHRRPKRTAAK